MQGAPGAKKAKLQGGAAPPAVMYKFHEGFTNAVRRPVYMRDLI